MPEIGNLPWLQTWRASLRQALHTTALALNAFVGRRSSAAPQTAGPRTPHVGASASAE